jgi:hypothetical protein
MHAGKERRPLTYCKLPTHALQCLPHSPSVVNGCSPSFLKPPPHLLLWLLATFISCGGALLSAAVLPVLMRPPPTGTVPSTTDGQEHQRELDSAPGIEEEGFDFSVAVVTVTGSSSMVVHDALEVVPAGEPDGTAGGGRLHGRRRVHGVLVVMRQVRLRVVVVHRRQLHRQELWTKQAFF